MTAFFIDGKSSESLKLHHSNTCTSQLHMLIAITIHAVYGAQILPDHLPECTCAGPVQDSYRSHANHQRIVDKIGNSLQSFVATHTAHVNFGTERKFALTHLIGCGRRNQRIVFMLFLFQLITYKNR